MQGTGFDDEEKQKKERVEQKTKQQIVNTFIMPLPKLNDEREIWTLLFFLFHLIK